jgi:hypothetical protein
MKKTILAVALSLSTITATAAPQLPPEVKLNIFLNVANMVTAMVLGVPTHLYMLANPGSKPAVCEAMGGTVNMDGGDQCPGGVWLKLIPYVKDATT